MLKKVLIITYYFPPSGGAGVQRWLKFCKYLPEYGVEPIVITVDYAKASYPQIDETLLADISSELQVYRTQTKEILSLYKKVSPNGQLPHTGFANEKNPNLKQKVSRFIRGNFFLPDPRRGWNRYAFAKACELIEQESIDTVVTTSPPHSTQLVGLKLKRRYPSIKWISDLRDPWSDIYYNKDLFQTAPAKWYNAHLERDVLENADEIITVSGDCVRNFQSKSAKPLPIHLVPNGYDEEDFCHAKLSKESITGESGKLLISYVGSMGPQYDTDTFLKALELLTPEVRSKIELQFVGGGSAIMEEKLSRFKESSDLIYSIQNYVSHAKAVEYMSGSDMLLLLLPEQENNKGIVTGKLFEYMASGKPVISVCYTDGDAAKILSEYESSGIFAFGDAEKIAEYIALAVKAKEDGSYHTKFAVNTDAATAYSRRKLCKKVADLILSK